MMIVDYLFCYMLKKVHYKAVYFCIYVRFTIRRIKNKLKLFTNSTDLKSGIR